MANLDSKRIPPATERVRPMATVPGEIWWEEPDPLPVYRNTPLAERATRDVNRLVSRLIRHPEYKPSEGDFE
jgi:hypothetical protein